LNDPENLRSIQRVTLCIYVYEGLQGSFGGWPVSVKGKKTRPSFPAAFFPASRRAWIAPYVAIFGIDAVDPVAELPNPYFSP